MDESAKKLSMLQENIKKEKQEKEKHIAQMDDTLGEYASIHKRWMATLLVKSLLSRTCTRTVGAPSAR